MLPSLASTFIFDPVRAFVTALALPVLLIALLSSTAGPPLLGAPPEEPAEPLRPSPEAARLLERVARGGQPLSDEEIEKLLAEYPPEQVGVSLVMVPVVVTDRRGRPVAGLEPTDFRIFDRGERRPLAYFSEEGGRPFRAVVLVDVSGSMGGERARERMGEALLPFAREVGLVDRIRLLSFSDAGVQVRTPWTRRAMLMVEEAVSLPRGGRTALADALVAAASQLDWAPGERQAIVLVSDGVENASEASVAEAIEAARGVGVPVYVLGIGGIARAMQERRTDLSPMEVLRRIAEETGGRFFFMDGEEVAERAADQIREDLRHQYWVAFKPTSPPDGRFRPITIDVRKRGAEVRARLGYR